MHLHPLFLVFIGGGLGSTLRYALSLWPGNPSGGFPWGTLTANLLACLVLGLAVQYLTARSGLPTSLKPLLLIGFCGGFSTFSTFSLETFRMIQAGQWMMALVYVMVSTLSCLIIFFIITQLWR